jgi:thiol:disulfide interchange protein
MIKWLLLLSIFFCSGGVAAEENLSAELILSRDSYAVSDTVIGAIKLTIPPAYHLYGNPIGPGIGKPVVIKAGNAHGVKWNRIIKQNARKFTPASGDWVWAYEKEAYFFIKGTVTGGVEGSVVSDTLTIDGLICHTACIPVNVKIPVSFPIKAVVSGKGHFVAHPELLKLYSSLRDSMDITNATPSLSLQNISGQITTIGGLGEIGGIAEQNSSDIPEWDYSPSEKKIEFNIFLAILFGFIAGIILNVMPCVLPVLGIKILSFAQSNNGNRKDILLRSGIFSLGIFVVFMILASLASFANFSWGEQFQNPKVLVGIIVLIVVFALGMFDVFTITVPGVIGGMERKSGNGLWGDFLRGMFATVLATPCSGPLLGATLAWTLTQSPLVVFTVFASIGLGMASPYIILSASSKLARLIPRPGNWMQDFKYIMGFILLGMAAYLMIGLPSEMLISTIGLCLVLSFAVWGYARYAPWGSSFRKRFIVALIMLTVSAGGIYFNFVTLYRLISTDSEVSNLKQDEWSPFSSKVLKDAHANGIPVMIDFTANWCMNCQYNKVTVLHSKKVMDLVRQKHIITMKADLTRPDPVIESLMTHLGSRSVPFLAVFPGDKPFEPVVMRDLLNKGALVSVLEQLNH